MSHNLQMIQSTYENSPQENAKNLKALLDENSSWTEAAGFPYAGTYVGSDEIFTQVFRRLATEWDAFQAKVHTYLADGDKVAAFGVYSGTYKQTGKAFEAAFAHLYHLKDGKIVTMQQIVDSALVNDALK
ncbi:nuclear transport factor 2 family protein [Acinetobacter stercoris]|uniref:SnoaL-like domain protein n=1 Tax=Acinetobacter stercoris TaxID=2126983 RepID=A0A2U3MW88_9GAMM|nr:nuclear transport factor 2 family protein [Acinetobacter stercoris]SPL69623.1 SnoaL-like domain protein [Acinetobacter stercoris]